MKQTKEQRDITAHYCNYCNKEYIPAIIQRIYGKESMVALLGYCSAKCYTNDKEDSEMLRDLVNAEMQEQETSISKDSLEGAKWFDDQFADGISDEDKERIFEALNNYNALKEINRELIEALEAIVDRAEMRFPHFEKEAGLETVNKAKSALQKAKQL